MLKEWEESVVEEICWILEDMETPQQRVVVLSFETSHSLSALQSTIDPGYRPSRLGGCFYFQLFPCWSFVRCSILKVPFHFCFHRCDIRCTITPLSHKSCIVFPKFYDICIIFIWNVWEENMVIAASASEFG